MFTIDWDRIKSLSYNEKLDCIPYMEELYKLLMLCRQEGIIPLQKKAKCINDPLTKLAYELLMQGRSPSTIRSILTNYIDSSNLSNEEYLKRIILLEFTIGCQLGDLPQDIWFKFASYLGVELLEVMAEKLEWLEHQ